MLRSANPTLGSSTFENFDSAADAGDVMTLQGTVNKTLILLLGVMLTATWTWTRVFAGGLEAVYPYMLGGAIGGFVVALITCFKQTWSPITAPLYAVLEGLFLGGISAVFELRYPGIAFQAVTCTFGTLFALLIVYSTRLVKPTENFKLGVCAATGGIALVYLASFIMHMFGVPMPYIHSNGPIGIGISVFVIIIAALNLVLDFDFIESGAERRAPKYMEWYAAFGLLVTLIWLYVEFLRLLAKLQSRK